MKELKEIRFNETDVILKDNIVRGSILPEKASELNRNLLFTGDTVVEGPIFGNRIEMREGEIEIQGAVFAQKELYIQAEMKGKITFKKAVGSANSVVSRGADNRVMFLSDINAKSVVLYNAYVAGNIYADNITLNNCVVIGGVFASQNAELTHCIVGTFNSPEVRLEQEIYLLLPSAFSIQQPDIAPGTRMYNLSLADLGSLYRGAEQSPESGKIAMDLSNDEIKSNLVGEAATSVLRSYTVVGKVLAADIIDTDRFQNHFLLSVAALGPQLLRTYDMGTDANGNTATLDADSIRDFFFNLLSGRIEVRNMDGSFKLSDIAIQQAQ
jgi:hypothetical protein